MGSRHIVQRAWILQILSWTVASSLAWGSVNEDARILAGIDGLNDGGGVAMSLQQMYSSAPSLFRAENAQRMSQFFAKHLPRGQKTQGLIYLFGGPDALFPQKIFPNYNKMLLVGLEPAGDLPDASAMSHAARNQKIVDVARAYANSLRNSYFITSHMAKDLAEYGTTTIIAAGLAVQGFDVLSIEKVSLDKSGQVQKGHGQLVKGVQIHFRRPNKSTADIFYFQYNLADENMAKNPELTNFIRQNRFDTAFYKAASFVSHNSNFKLINSLVLDQVSFLVQADDGIPYSTLASPDQAPHWSVELFGLYTAPDKIFEISAQPALRVLYGQEICLSGAVQDQDLWQKVWQSPACSEKSQNRFRRVRWSGYIPFRFGYAAVSGPKVVGPEEMHKFGTLMVMEK